MVRYGLLLWLVLAAYIVAVFPDAALLGDLAIIPIAAAGVALIGLIPPKKGEPH